MCNNKMRKNLFENILTSLRKSLSSFPADVGGTVSFTFDNGFIYGTDTIRLVAGPSNTIAESNENNNECFDNYYFDGKAQIVIDEFVLTTSFEDTVTTERINYRFAFSNVGNAPSGDLVLDIYIDKEQI